MITNREIFPKVGLGDIRLGSDREMVISCFDSPPESFLAQSWHRFKTDSYYESNLQFSYDDQGKLFWISFHPNEDYSLLGIKLKKRKVNKLLRLLLLKGYESEYDDHGYYYFDSLGFSIVSLNNKKTEGFILYSGTWQSIQTEQDNGSKR